MTNVTAVDVTGTPTVEPLSSTAVVDGNGVTNNTPPTTDPKKDEESKRFAQLAHREKLLRAKAQEIAKQEATLKAREEMFQQQQKPKEIDWKERIKQDPVGMFAEAGLSYEDIVNNYVNQNPNDIPIRQLQQEIKAAREENAQFRQRLEERDKASVEQAIKQIKFDVQNMAKAQGEEYEVLNAAGDDGYEMVVQLIQKEYEENGHVIDMSEAAKAVEDYLLDKYVGIAKLKKIQAKLTPAQAEALAEQAMPTAKPSGVQVTPKANSLSHSMAPSTGRLSAKEKRERAILAFKGQL